MTTRHRLIAGPGVLTVTVSSASHVGLVRTVNEDAVLAEPPVFAVADGMGGHAFGDRASATAVLALREEFDPEQPPEPGDVLTAIRRANDAVRELTAWGGDDRVIAGTTLAGVALVLEHPDAPPRWMVFNLGDSRVYRWEQGSPSRLEQVTVDHSLVQELLDAGLIDAQRAQHHPERNVITRALGAADEARPEAWLLPATPAQSFLICSDGLTRELDDQRIGELLAAGDPLGDRFSEQETAVDRLLAATLEAGGHDNVSIMLLSAEYQAPGVLDPIDERTSDRALSPELTDTRPRW